MLLKEAVFDRKQQVFFFDHRDRGMVTNPYHP